MVLNRFSSILELMLGIEKLIVVGRLSVGLVLKVILGNVFFRVIIRWVWKFLSVEVGLNRVVLLMSCRMVFSVVMLGMFLVFECSVFFWLLFVISGVIGVLL